MVAAYENVNYPVECLSSGRVPPFTGGCQAAQKHFHHGADGRGSENSERTKEARGLSLYEHGHDLPAGRRRDGGVS